MVSLAVKYIFSVSVFVGIFSVRLPQLLAQSALTPTEVTQVQKLLGDFLRFMQKNHAQFFVQEYEDEEPVRFDSLQ